MATIISVAEFRAWAGAVVPSTVSDQLIELCLNEAEAGILADIGSPVTVADVIEHPLALAEFKGEELRGGAGGGGPRRNSPESVAGAGSDGIVYTVPVRDADSQRAIWHIQSHLKVPEGVS